MTRIVSVLMVFMANYWQSAVQYRLGALIWIVNGMVTPLILMGVWLVVLQSRSLPFDQAQIVTYYILTMLVVRLTQSWVAEDLTHLIKEGRLSNYLVKPISFIWERIAKDQAYRAMRLVSLTPFLMAMMVLNPFSMQVSSRLSSWLLFFGCIILGLIINFLIEVLIGLTTFWVGDAYGAFSLLFMIQELLSGMIIPFNFMPEWLQSLALWSPFYVQIGLPLDVLMGLKEFDEVSLYLGVILVWIALVSLLIGWSYSSLVKKYSAVGT